MEVDLKVRVPFAGDQLLAFLRSRAVPGVEYIAGRIYGRTLRLPHGPATVHIAFPASASCERVGVTIDACDPRDMDDALIICRRIVDAGAHPRAIDATLSADPALTASVASVPGIRLPGAADGSEMLIRALLGQQVSVRAARTALGRLTLRLDDALPTPDGQLTHLFPSPEAIAALDGIPGPLRRSETILKTAAAMASGELRVHPGRSTADLTAELISRSGIGPWTAGYVAMRALVDRDVLLTGDLALRRGATRLGLPGTEGKLLTRAEAWRPFRSYAGLHLWRAAATASS